MEVLGEGFYETIAIPQPILAGGVFHLSKTAV